MHYFEAEITNLDLQLESLGASPISIPCRKGNQEAICIGANPSGKTLASFPAAEARPVIVPESAICLKYLLSKPSTIFSASVLFAACPDSTKESTVGTFCTSKRSNRCI